MTTTKTKQTRGLRVGELGTLTVGVRGTVEARDDDAKTVTIGGATLPIACDTDRGIVHVSQGLPEVGSYDSGYEDGVEAAQSELSARRNTGLDRMTAAILRHHDDNHDGPARFCGDTLCQAAEPERALYLNT